MRCKKTILLLVAMMATGIALAEEQSAGVPEPYALQRYQSIMEKSPFVRETASTAVSTEGFAKDFVITGHFRIGRIIFLNVLDKKTQKRISLSSEETDSTRPKVISLQNTDDPSKVQAVVQLGAETATIAFDRDSNGAKNSARQTADATTSNQSKLGVALNPPIMEDGRPAPLPLVFVPLETDKSASDQKKAMIENVRKEFQEKLAQSSTQDATDPEYRQHWEKWSRQADATYKAMFGVADFQARQRASVIQGGSVSQ